MKGPGGGGVLRQCRNLGGAEKESEPPPTLVFYPRLQAGDPTPSPQNVVGVQQGCVGKLYGGVCTFG